MEELPAENASVSSLSECCKDEGAELCDSTLATMNEDPASENAPPSESIIDEEEELCDSTRTIAMEEPAAEEASPSESDEEKMSVPSPSESYRVEGEELCDSTRTIMNEEITPEKASPPEFNEDEETEQRDPTPTPTEELTSEKTLPSESNDDERAEQSDSTPAIMMEELPSEKESPSEPNKDETAEPCDSTRTMEELTPENASPSESNKDETAELCDSTRTDMNEDEHEPSEKAAPSESNKDETAEPCDSTLPTIKKEKSPEKPSPSNAELCGKRSPMLILKKISTKDHFMESLSLNRPIYEISSDEERGSVGRNEAKKKRSKQKKPPKNDESDYNPGDDERASVGPKKAKKYRKKPKMPPKNDENPSEDERVSGNKQRRKQKLPPKKDENPSDYDSVSYFERPVTPPTRQRRKVLRYISENDISDDSSDSSDDGMERRARKSRRKRKAPLWMSDTVQDGRPSKIKKIETRSVTKPPARSATKPLASEKTKSVAKPPVNERARSAAKSVTNEKTKSALKPSVIEKIRNAASEPSVVDDPPSPISTGKQSFIYDKVTKAFVPIADRAAIRITDDSGTEKWLVVDKDFADANMDSASNKRPGNKSSKETSDIQSLKNSILQQNVAVTSLTSKMTKLVEETGDWIQATSHLGQIVLKLKKEIGDLRHIMLGNSVLRKTVTVPNRDVPQRSPFKKRVRSESPDTSSAPEAEESISAEDARRKQRFKRKPPKNDVQILRSPQSNVVLSVNAAKKPAVTVDKILSEREKQQHFKNDKSATRILTVPQSEWISAVNAAKKTATEAKMLQMSKNDKNVSRIPSVPQSELISSWNAANKPISKNKILTGKAKEKQQKPENCMRALTSPQSKVVSARAPSKKPETVNYTLTAKAKDQKANVLRIQIPQSALTSAANTAKKPDTAVNVSAGNSKEKQENPKQDKNVMRILTIPQSELMTALNAAKPGTGEKTWAIEKQDPKGSGVLRIHIPESDLISAVNTAKKLDAEANVAAENATGTNQKPKRVRSVIRIQFPESDILSAVNKSKNPEAEAKVPAENAKEIEETPNRVKSIMRLLPLPHSNSAVNEATPPPPKKVENSIIEVSRGTDVAALSAAINKYRLILPAPDISNSKKSDDAKQVDDSNSANDAESELQKALSSIVREAIEGEESPKKSSNIDNEDCSIIQEEVNELEDSHTRLFEAAEDISKTQNQEKVATVVDEKNSKKKSNIVKDDKLEHEKNKVNRPNVNSVKKRVIFRKNSQTQLFESAEDISKTQNQEKVTTVADEKCSKKKSNIVKDDKLEQDKNKINRPNVNSVQKRVIFRKNSQTQLFEVAEDARELQKQIKTTTVADDAPPVLDKKCTKTKSNVNVEDEKVKQWINQVTKPVDSSRKNEVKRPDDNEKLVIFEQDFDTQLPEVGEEISIDETANMLCSLSEEPRSSSGEKIFLDPEIRQGNELNSSDIENQMVFLQDHFPEIAEEAVICETGDETDSYYDQTVLDTVEPSKKKQKLVLYRSNAPSQSGDQRHQAGKSYFVERSVISEYI